MSHSDPAPQTFLLLIENSSALAGYWPDLRDCYLPRLVEQLSGTLPAHLTNIFLSESRPTSHDFRSSGTKQCSSLEAGLTECQFNYGQDNRLSVSHIQGGIKFLSSVPANEVRHLIVVAATAPKDFGFGHPIDPWIELAKMLTKEEVYLHLALASTLRSGRLTNLFEQTLKWQHNTEEPLWLPKYSTHLIFRVSAPQSYPDSVQVIPGTEAEQSTCSATWAQRDLIPPDMYTTKALEDMPSESPSLVSQLQQVHGLTKKKVYGTKPARIPFIKDERVRDRYRKGPPSQSSPSSIPLAPETGSPPLLTRGSRSRSNSRADRAFSSRLQRVVDPNAAAGQPQWQQQQPPMPAAEGDSSDQSPGLYSSSVPLSYPYALTSSGSGQSMVPAEFDLPRAAPKVDTSSGLNFAYTSPSGYGSDSSSYFPDSAAASSAFSAMPSSLDSSAYLSQAADFGGPGPASELDFQPPLFQQHHDDQAQYSFVHGQVAPPPTASHIHAPAPSLAIPTTQMDLLASAAAAAPRHPLPFAPSPLSILPPIAASAFQDRVAQARAHAQTASVTLSMQPQNANVMGRIPSSAAPRVAMAASSSASGRLRDAPSSAFASSSSSSLTGWAG